MGTRGREADWDGTQRESSGELLRKKKRLNWWCVFGRIEIEERIWRTAASSYERVFAPRIAVSNRGRSKPLDRVLSDFGAEHSFAKAAQQCKEHYGFEIPPSAARTATLKQAERARLKLEAQYKEAFRLLPVRGSEHVVAEADGTMICTVEPGKRKAKRPRFWQEMRLVAAQAHGCSQSHYAASFGKVQLRQAIDLDKDIRLVALDDEDLRPLWDWIGGLK